MGLIYVVTANQVEGNQIVESLSQMHHEKYRMEAEMLRPAQLQTLMRPEVDLLVYNLPHNLNMNIKQQFIGWRKRGILSSFLVLAPNIDPKSLNDFQDLRNFVVLEKPFEGKELTGVAKKLLTSVEVAQRTHRRFNTQQQVQVSSYKTDFKSNSNVQNISLGGLCLHGACANLQVGDLLKVHFILDRLNAERSVHARVVWVDDEGGERAGLKFVKEDEVYSDLLKSIG